MCYCVHKAVLLSQFHNTLVPFLFYGWKNKELLIIAMRYCLCILLITLFVSSLSITSMNFCSPSPQWLHRKMTSFHCFCMDCTASYTIILHNICLKTVLYFCKRTVLKVLCYQNFYAEKHGRNVRLQYPVNYLPLDLVSSCVASSCEYRVKCLCLI